MIWKYGGNGTEAQYTLGGWQFLYPETLLKEKHNSVKEPAKHQPYQPLAFMPLGRPNAHGEDVCIPLTLQCIESRALKR